MDFNETMTLFKDMLYNSHRIVFFGGAGVSTESGIPDFRSASGLYQKAPALQENGYKDYSPEEILHRDFFLHKTQHFYRYYFTDFVHPNAKPNDAHQALSQLEREGKLSAVITQNVDGLHQMAGSKRVIELHGSVHRNYCMDCGASYTLAQMLAKQNDIPRCDACQGLLKPDVVLYGESLSEQALTDAVDQIRRADLLIVGGTSLSVYPAAGLLQYYKNGPLVLINRDETAYDSYAHILFRESIGSVFKAYLKLRS